MSKIRTHHARVLSEVRKGSQFGAASKVIAKPRSSASSSAVVVNPSIQRAIAATVFAPSIAVAAPSPPQKPAVVAPSRDVQNIIDAHKEAIPRYDVVKPLAPVRDAITAAPIPHVLQKGDPRVDRSKQSSPTTFAPLPVTPSSNPSDYNYLPPSATVETHNLRKKKMNAADSAPTSAANATGGAAPTAAAEQPLMQPAQDEREAESPIAQQAQNPNSPYYPHQAEIETTGFGEESSPIASYIDNNYLHSVAIEPSDEFGMIPLMATVPLGIRSRPELQYPNGAVYPGLDPRVDAALEESKKRLMSNNDNEKQKLAAEALVTRARCGDQNARAVLELVKQNATGPNGNSRAQQAYQHAMTYIRTNPASDMGAETTFQGPGPSSVNRAAVRLANGPQLSNARIGDMVNVFGGRKSRKRKILHTGITKFGAEATLSEISAKLDRIEAALLDFGRSIGLARAIQLVRQPGVPIGVHSPVAAWELGE